MLKSDTETMVTITMPFRQVIELRNMLEDLVLNNTEFYVPRDIDTAIAHRALSTSPCTTTTQRRQTPPRTCGRT